MAEKMNYKELCEAPFEMDSPYGVNFEMLVYTGEKREELPVFKTVLAIECCKVRIGASGKDFWGIVGFDPKTEESQWYNYNDCVSLENWAVLDRMLKSRFGWMELTAPELILAIRTHAKAQLAEGI